MMIQDWHLSMRIFVKNGQGIIGKVVRKIMRS